MGGLRHLFLDACFFKEDKSEEDSFNASMEALYNMLQAASPLQTSEVKENVQTENAKFQKAYEEKLKLLEEQQQALLEKHQRKIIEMEEERLKIERVAAERVEEMKKEHE